MKADKDRLPLLVTPMVAKTEFNHILERIQATGDRFLIVRRRQPEAIILGIDDFLEITGLDQDWIEYAWKATQEQ